MGDVADLDEDREKAQGHNVTRLDISPALPLDESRVRRGVSRFKLPIYARFDDVWVPLSFPGTHAERPHYCVRCRENYKQA